MLAAKNYFYGVLIALSCNNALTQAAYAQPTPGMAKQWQAIATPKIQAKLQSELKRKRIELSGRNTVMVRAYLEKDGKLNGLKIDHRADESSVSKQKFKQLGEAFVHAVADAAPLPYSSESGSRLEHLSLYAVYHTAPEEIEVGITQPEDHPGP